MKGTVIAGLDIGTTKICAMTGHFNRNNRLEILGYGIMPSIGLRNGLVIDIERTVDSIRQAVKQAEKMAGWKIKEVNVGIAGAHISSQNAKGIVEVRNSRRGVTRADVQRAIEKAKASIPFDRIIINCIPQEFICDDQGGYKNPLEISCSRLEVKVHLVTAALSSAHNIIRCVNQAGLVVNDLLLESLASAIAVLDDKEKELGVLVMDIGGGTTDMAIFDDNNVECSSDVPFGGDNITRDIFRGLKISQEEAEELKKHYGYAIFAEIDPADKIEITRAIDGARQQISRQELCEIIYHRLAEILELSKERLEKTPYINNVNAGVVLTGGTSLLSGAIELARQIFDLPVRIGVPLGIEGRFAQEVTSPIFATGIGLVIHGLENDLKPPLQYGNMFNKIIDVFRDIIESYK